MSKRNRLICFSCDKKIVRMFSEKTTAHFIYPQSYLLFYLLIYLCLLSIQETPGFILKVNLDVWC